jgi:cyclic nucleotide gated channel alpha 4
MCAVIYSLWLAPPRIAYTHLNVYYRWHLLGADVLVDIIFAIDICVRMHTGHLEHGIVVSDVRLLRRAYLWSSGAVVDAIALLPVDYLVVSIDSRYRALWRSNRWLKIARIWDVQRMIETRTSWPDAVRVLALIHTLLVNIFWSG